GVEYFIAYLEQRDLGTDGIDDSGGVVAEDFHLAFGRGGALAHLVIDRIGRDRLHRNPDVTTAGLRLGGVEIDQGLGIIDWKRLFIADGFHVLWSPSNGCGGVTVALASFWQVL